MIEFQHENQLVRHSSVRYVFPPMIGMIFAQIAPVVDGICVSNSLGEEALSAVGTVGPVNYLFNIIAALGGIGCGVYLSKCSGNGEKGRAAVGFTRTMVFMAIASIILSVIGVVFSDIMLKGLCATPENYAFAKEYLIVYMIGAIFPVFNFAGDYILANDNNQDLAMVGDIVGAIVNIIVDFVGVFVFHFGIWVVAFGTIFGSFCCCLVYLLHLKKPDRLCRIVPLKRDEKNPGYWEICKPGSAEALMYLMFTVQLLIQNFVLRENAGTLGISNSAVIENLQLVLSIIIAGVTDATYPLAAAYSGEQNQSGVLMVKRMLTRLGFIMLLPIVIILCLFPQIMIVQYAIAEPVMLRSLPTAVRIICFVELIQLITTLLIDYLSVIEQEKKANIALVIQSVVQISFTLLLSDRFGLNAPWYAAVLGTIASFIYLWFFCDNLPEGIVRFHQKNLLVLTGGTLDRKNVEKWKMASKDILSEKEIELVEDKMFSALMTSIPEGVSPNSTFTILKRDDGMNAVILRYESKEDYIGDSNEIPEQDEEEEDFKPDVCIKSEFLGARRLMLVISGQLD